MPKVQMLPDLAQMLMDQRAAFVKKLGREPGPQDLVLCDADKDVPTPISPERMETDLAEALRKAGFDEGRVDAFLKGMR